MNITSEITLSHLSHLSKFHSPKALNNSSSSTTSECKNAPPEQICLLPCAHNYAGVTLARMYRDKVVNREHIH